MDTVITNGQIVTPDGIVRGDLAIADGKLYSVGPSVNKAREVIDAEGKFVMPGGVDPHVHIEQMSGMGLWNADTFETATRSAAMGGTTTVISFAAQSTGQSLLKTVKDYAERAERGAAIDYAFHLTLTDTSVPGFDASLAKLIKDGHRSLKVFTTYNIQLNDTQLLQIFDTARRHGALVCVHAENDAIIARARTALIEADRLTPLDHAASRPRLAEIEAVERICRFSELVGQPVMLFHISTLEAAGAIKAAQKRGVPVWAETCPHYLLMTEAILDKPGLEGAKWMCSPPQRLEADQTALWSALHEGTISLVSSDHAPYRFDDTGKLSAGTTPGFHEIANGLPGLETRLPLMFDAVVSQERGGPLVFAELTSHAPARLYGLERKGTLEPGKDADVVIWNPDVTRTFGADDLHDNVGYNPWVGRTVTGWPEHVLLRGRTVAKDGVYFGVAGQGKWVDRPEMGTPPKARMTGTRGAMAGAI